MLRHGERRYHVDVGPCLISRVSGCQRMLVAIASDSRGRIVGVYDARSLDDRGWGNPRRTPGSITDDERRAAVELRHAGMTQSEIARELSISRPAIGKIVNGIPAGGGRKKQKNRVLSADEKVEIRELLEKGWRKTVIAGWIGCHPQTIADCGE